MQLIRDVQKYFYSYNLSCSFYYFEFTFLSKYLVTSIKHHTHKSHSMLTHFLCYEVQLSFLPVYMDWGIYRFFPLCVCTVCTYTRTVCVRSKYSTSYRDTTEKGGERERLTQRGGLGGPGHRWLWEADVPAELFRVVPASSETETEVRRANSLPQNGWLDLGKQMLKNAFCAQKCHHERYNTRKQQPS